MYRRILIATDGSPLSRKAAEEGVALARSVGASVVGFHARAPVILPYYAEPAIVLPPKTEELMEKQAIAAAKKYLARIEAIAKKSGCRVQGHRYRRCISRRFDHQGCEEGEMRTDSNGFSWPPRHLAPVAGKRDQSRTHARAHAGIGGALTPG